MGRRCGWLMAGAVVVLWIGSCRHRGAPDPAPEPTSETVTLAFQIELNPQVYQDSAWGDPPQMAVWLQNEADPAPRTVAVTHRTGAGDWEGKVECAVALPGWVAAYNRETGTAGPPTWDRPAADAVTCATPPAMLNATARVRRGTRWRYFVEVNVSGDYSVHFPQRSADGRSDRYGNGQPSIVYRGAIEAVEGATSRPALWGRTDQHVPVVEVTTDLRQITTARDLLATIHISCVR